MYDLFYERFYSAAYIDAFVGILAGCGFAYVLLEKNRDILYYTYILLICFTLVLAKDVGMYFSCFIGFVFAVKFFSEHDLKSFGAKQWVSCIFTSLLPVISALITKFSWKLELITSKAPINFGGKIDIINYSKIFCHQAKSALCHIMFMVLTTKYLSQMNLFRNFCIFQK